MKIKNLAFVLSLGCGLILNQSAHADANFITNSAKTSAANETVVAQVSKNMIQGIVSIDLVQIHPADANVPGADRWIVRTVRAARSRQYDLTRYQATIELMLASLQHADIDPVITKIRDFTCKMGIQPTPQLAVLRTSDKTGQTTLETVLSNQSCAYHDWLAPQSEQGEEAAKVLYRFMLDSVILVKSAKH